MSLQARTLTPSFRLTTQKYVTLNTSVIQIGGGGGKGREETLQAVLIKHSNSKVYNVVTILTTDAVIKNDGRLHCKINSL